MSMGVHHPYHLDLCADDEEPFQLIIRPGWDAPHVRCFPRTFCAWPCLLRQVGTVLGSPYDCVVARLAYANPGSRHDPTTMRTPDDFPDAYQQYLKRSASRVKTLVRDLTALVQIPPQAQPQPRPQLMVRECTLIFDPSEE